MNTSTETKRGRRFTATSSLRSGEGGIRTPETLAGLPVFKTGATNSQALILQRDATWTNCGLQDSLQADAEFARVAAAWLRLSKQSRRRILAIVDRARGGSSPTKELR